MFVFRYILDLGVIKKLGIAGMMLSISIGEKCGFILFIYVDLVVQLFMNWYLLLFVWRGQEAEAIVFCG